MTVIYASIVLGLVLAMAFLQIRHHCKVRSVRAHTKLNSQEFYGLPIAGSTVYFVNADSNTFKIEAQKVESVLLEMLPTGGVRVRIYTKIEGYREYYGEHARIEAFQKLAQLERWETQLNHPANAPDKFEVERFYKAGTKEYNINKYTPIEITNMPFYYTKAEAQEARNELIITGMVEHSEKQLKLLA